MNSVLFEVRNAIQGPTSGLDDCNVPKGFNAVKLLESPFLPRSLPAIEPANFNAKAYEREEKII